MSQEIIKTREIDYGNISQLGRFLFDHRIVADHLKTYKNQLTFRRKGKRKVEIFSKKIESTGKCWDRQDPEIVSDFFREKKLKLATLWEMAAIFPCRWEIQEFRDFINEFGEDATLFAFGQHIESFAGTLYAIIYSDCRSMFRYDFQYSSPTSNIWYVGYRYIK